MDIWTTGIPTPLSLAIVAVIGYFVGRVFARRSDAGGKAKCELKRAWAVIRELEGISQQVRRNLATHHSNIAAFKKRVDELSRSSEGDPWRELSEEAERMFKPTLKLSTQIAHAYDEIRQQTNQLMTFTEVRTDPLTGLRNRRALDEGLVTHFALASRYGATLSLAIFDIDHFKAVNDGQGHLQGDHVLQQVARLLDDSVRDTDVAARFGGEEFVVLMPETDLIGAGILAERVRNQIEEQLSVTVSGGLSQLGPGDNPRTLLSRADAALYCAKSAGRNFVFQHTGDEVEPVTERSPAENWRPSDIAKCGTHVADSPGSHSESRTKASQRGSSNDRSGDEDRRSYSRKHKLDPPMPAVDIDPLTQDQTSHTS